MKQTNIYLYLPVCMSYLCVQVPALPVPGPGGLPLRARGGRLRVRGPGATERGAVPGPQRHHRAGHPGHGAPQPRPGQAALGFWGCPTAGLIDSEFSKSGKAMEYLERRFILQALKRYGEKKKSTTEMTASVQENKIKTDKNVYIVLSCQH